MAPKTTRTGPGTLTIGDDVGTDFSVQVTSCTVTPNVGDTLTVLSGDTISDYTAALAVTVLQDLTTSGIVAYSWSNAGNTVDFEFTPNSAIGASISGRVKIDPIQIGGTVGERATADVTWQCPELPTFTPGS